ncbi:MAG: alpha/beta fold hydrolase [Roseiflexaceae bacterium]
MSTTLSKDMQVRFRTVDGITIRYAESDGHRDHPILLTSPWPESLYAFLPIWQSLSQHSHLLAIDLPGFGQSERRNDLLSPRAMGEFLVHLIDEWELNAPHVVAPDVGTAAALFAAALHPGKLGSLVVGNGGVAYPLQTGGVLKAIIEAPDLEAFRSIDPRVTLGASLDEGHEHYRLPEEVREDYLQSYEGDRFVESMRYVRNYPQELPVLGELLAQIQTPVQIINSRRDVLVPPANGDYLHARLPNSKLDVLDAAHYPWEDVADQYAAIISAWVKGSYQDTRA